MGQKVRPTGFRTGIMIDWLSNWYANKQDFADLLLEDLKIRRHIKKKYRGAGLSRVRIARTREKVVVYVHAARVGVIIGKKGAEVEKLTKALENLTYSYLGDWITAQTRSSWPRRSARTWRSGRGSAGR